MSIKEIYFANFLTANICELLMFDTIKTPTNTIRDTVERFSRIGNITSGTVYALQSLSVRFQILCFTCDLLLKVRNTDIIWCNKAILECIFVFRSLWSHQLLTSCPEKGSSNLSSTYRRKAIYFVWSFKRVSKGISKCISFDRG